MPLFKYKNSIVNTDLIKRISQVREDGNLQTNFSGKHGVEFAIPNKEVDFEVISGALNSTSAFVDLEKFIQNLKNTGSHYLNAEQDRLKKIIEKTEQNNQ